MSQFNPFAAASSGQLPAEPLASGLGADQAEQIAQEAQQYLQQDYQTSGSVNPLRYALNPAAANEINKLKNDEAHRKASKSRQGNESLKKRKSFLNIDESMEMNDEESQKLKQMMQDSERRKVLQKKGVSYKNSQAAHQDLDRKSKKHMFQEAIKIEDASRAEQDGVAVHRSQQVKKNALLLRNSE